jgi:hypothetical protein
MKDRRSVTKVTKITGKEITLKFAWEYSDVSMTRVISELGSRHPTSDKFSE